MSIGDKYTVTPFTYGMNSSGNGGQKNGGEHRRGEG